MPEVDTGVRCETPLPLGWTSTRGRLDSPVPPEPRGFRFDDGVMGAQTLPRRWHLDHGMSVRVRHPADESHGFTETVENLEGRPQTFRKSALEVGKSICTWRESILGKLSRMGQGAMTQRV